VADGNTAATGSNTALTADRLFVWVPAAAGNAGQGGGGQDEDGDADSAPPAPPQALAAHASNEHWPKQGRSVAACVFLHAVVPSLTSTTKTTGTGTGSTTGGDTDDDIDADNDADVDVESEAATSTVSDSTEVATTTSPEDWEITSRQIQCMTMQPPVEEENEKVSDHGSQQQQQQQQGGPSSPDAMLHTLQMYTRQCFLPTVTAALDDKEMVAALQDKIRALDQALQQTAAAQRLPHVVLAVHPVLRDAAVQRSGDKLDWAVLGLEDYLRDDTFLNTVQAGVSQWIVQIRKITLLKNTPFPVDSASAAAALDEVAFWTQLQAELHSIQQQLKEPGVELTTGMLREAKRFVATLALENNTGLEAAVNVTTDICNFVQKYPVQQLQAARDFDKIAAAMVAIFDHLPKIRQSRYYSLDRSVQLLEATTAALRDSLLAVLQEQHSNLLFLDYKEYENKVRFPILDVFVQFDDRFEEWKDFLLEQGRRRKLPGMNKILEKIVLHHAPLKERLEQIHEFRSQQERLREVVHTVLREEEPAAIQQVEQAPRQIFATLNVLDLSSGGSKALDSALEEYDLQMDAMEERLARLLSDKLTACQVRE
jgi:hypothetical protein